MDNGGRKVPQVLHTDTADMYVTTWYHLHLSHPPGTCEQPEFGQKEFLELFCDAHEKVCFSSTLRNGAYVAAHATSCNVMQRDAAHGPMWSHVVPCGPMSQSRLSLCATQQLGRDESNVPSNTLLLLFLLPGSQHVMGGTCKIGIYLNGMAATNHSQADCFFRISIF